MDEQAELARILLKAIEGLPYDKKAELIKSALEGQFNKGYYTRDKHYRLFSETKYTGNDFNPIRTIERCKPVEGEIQG